MMSCIHDVKGFEKPRFQGVCKSMHVSRHAFWKDKTLDPFKQAGIMQFLQSTWLHSIDTSGNQS